MTDEQLAVELERAEGESDAAELAAELDALLSSHSLRDVILGSDPLAVAQLMTVVQSVRPDLAAAERDRLCTLVPELEALAARHPPKR
jgi:hypothetical protein